MKIVLSLITFITTASAVAQTVNFNVGKPFREFRELETALHSQVKENTSTHLLAENMAQPIRYVRVADEFEPKPVIEYFFKKSDSTVQEIQYEWDKQNFLEKNYQMTDKDFESRERLDLFIKKYNDLKAQITKRFGNSKSEGSLEPQAGLSYLEVDKKDSWDTDSISVLMYMSFSNQYLVRGNMTLPPAHRIRVYVKTKNETQENVSDVLKSAFKVDESQQKTAQKFIELLLNRKYEESWKLFSPEVKAKTTYESYVKAVEPVAAFKNEFGRKIELAFSGPRFISNGVYYSYSFKFKGDKNSPPSILLDVTFKLDGETIMGFQPKKVWKMN